MLKRALFLDRDGVINVDHGYVHTVEQFEFINGIFDLVAAANRLGYLVIIVTNQAGIARGYYSVAQFQDLTNWMKSRFVENGSIIDAVYYCPHHPEHGSGEYRIECGCRKPFPGMLLNAKYEFDLDMKKSIIVGDKETDIAAGVSANVGTLVLLGAKTESSSVIQVSEIFDIVSLLIPNENNHSITQI
jgi:D-glycero-D-manno-heptose 1,7-bisphosphate phosphatase